jgi:hypothetical protein
MNSYHLKYFFDACNEKSLTTAAKKNYVSQVAVTLAIKSLENELKVKLISHKRREFLLTKQGLKTYQYAKEVLTKFDDFKKDLHVGDQTQTIRFACTNSMFASFVSSAIVKFKKKNKNINFEIKLTSTDLIEKGIKDKQFDIGLTLNVAKKDSKNSLYHGHFVAVTNKTNKNDNFEDIYVTRINKPEVLIFLDKYKKKSNHQLQIKNTILSWEGIKNIIIVEESMGLIPSYLIDDKIKVLSQYPKVPYEMDLIFTGNTDCEEIFKKIRHFIEEEIQQSLGKYNL